ncbi:unnamed protein product, partial [Rotaria socialis]
LPIFPPETSIITLGVNDHLLLANVPNSYLSQDELVRRQQATNISNILTLNNLDNYHEPFGLSSIDINELSTRLQVKESIIRGNADRLDSICHRLLELHEHFRRETLVRPAVALDEPTLNSKQMSIVLEFFLQIDVDVFFMKTCRFRGAEPYPSTQGLFCNDESPKARYSMTPCHTIGCRCCVSLRYENEASSPSLLPPIDFEHSSSHCFANGYTTYLNCPATCTTSNIVYVMTCACGLYEFIDSTSGTLGDALAHHRLAINQMMHSFLTGCSVYHAMMTPTERARHRNLRKMRLYKHFAHCSTALHLFLEHNPTYWCFIPQSKEKAYQENDLFSKVVSMTRSEDMFTFPRRTYQQRKVLERLEFVKSIKKGDRHFSVIQVQQQRIFFDRFLLDSVAHMPYVETDFYKMKMIAVLPDDKSILLRYFIETLFIIHGEPRLNMICPNGLDPKKRYGKPYLHDWYQQINHPSMSCPHYITSLLEKIKELNLRPPSHPHDDDDDDDDDNNEEEQQNH